MSLDAIKSLPDVLASAKRITIKVGSALVVDAQSGVADAAWMRGLAQDIAALMAQGKSVLLVSSGAGALGRRYLGLTRKKLKLDEKQAAAAAGQPRLMSAWEEAFATVGLKTAQVLLTREDTEKRRRWLNARATGERGVRGALSRRLAKDSRGAARRQNQNEELQAVGRHGHTSKAEPALSRRELWWGGATCPVPPAWMLVPCVEREALHTAARSLSGYRQE